MRFRVDPPPGQSIADVNASGTFHCTWHLALPDGTYVGSIYDLGGDPSLHHTIIGGTDGFLGITGEHPSHWKDITPQRVASMSEDPSKRRVNGASGRGQHLYYVYPKFTPEIAITKKGPLVLHAAESSPVTAARPARRGETLIVRATGLEPVKPALNPPGVDRFHESPPAEVNSPVSVLFNGVELPVTRKVGWPGEINVYRLEFGFPPAPHQAP